MQRPWGRGVGNEVCKVSRDTDLREGRKLFQGLKQGAVWFHLYFKRTPQGAVRAHGQSSFPEMAAKDRVIQAPGEAP